MTDNTERTEPADTSHHVLKSIKSLIEISKRLKEKERESDSLRAENETLLEKFKKMEKIKNSDSQLHQNQKIAMRKLEEAENRLKTRTEYFDKERSIFVKNMEEMRRRMEDSESFRRFNEKEIEELQKVIDRIPSNLRLEAAWSRPVEKETMETLKRENRELSDDLKSAEFQLTLLKSQQQMVSDVLATEQKEREKAEIQGKDWKMLLEQQESQLYQEQEYIRVLEQETLEIDYLRSQNRYLSEENLSLKLLAESQARELEASKKSEKSDENESQLLKNLSKLTHRISELHEGRRLEQIPESLRSEAPPKFQSSEIFYQIANLLNIILAGHTVPPNKISEFWNFLMKRSELTEELIEEKIREVERLKGAEIQRVEEEFQKEKMEMRAELEEMRKVASDRLMEIKKMEMKGNETIPPAPDTNMSSLALRFKSQHAPPLSESESVEAAVQKLKEIKKMGTFPRFSAPKSKSDDGVRNRSQTELQQKLVDMESERERSEAELRYKLRKIELELEKEKEENKARAEKSMNGEKERIRMFRSDVVYEGVVYHAHPEDPKDKNWVLDRFLNNDDM